MSEIPDGRGRFNAGLLKTLTGGDPDSLRDVGEKAGPSRPATATVFIAANPPDFDRLDLTDAALEDRARILPYPPLPGDQRNPDVLDTVQHNPKACPASTYRAGCPSGGFLTSKPRRSASAIRASTAASSLGGFGRGQKVAKNCTVRPMRRTQ